MADKAYTDLVSSNIKGTCYVPVLIVVQF